MATIRKRTSADGSVSYQAMVRLKGYPPQSATFQRKTDAKEWAQRIETALKDGRHLPTNEAKQHTVAALVDRYLAQLARDASPHLDKRKQQLAIWKAEIGSYALVHVTPALIAQTRDRLLAEKIRGDKLRSPATVNRYLAALSKAFTIAVKEWHWLEDNPLRRVSKKQEAAGRVRFLDDKERERLLAACRASPLPELHLIVLMALTTGMRRGEILGLRWRDVDLSRGLIVLDKTKNKERRSVPIVPQVRELLETHAKVRRLGTDLVFPHPRKDAPVYMDEAFREAVKAAKVPDFRFHDLRHTAASYLAMSGATTAEIAAVLGHKTLAMVKRYAHLSEQHTASVVERMTRKFF